MRSLALATIKIYQRHLSPHKGFRCAYRAHTGRPGCSELGYRAIRRYGVFAGLALLRRRTRLCGSVYRRQLERSSGTWRGQRGYCDLPCDLPSLDAALACCDCGGCDWPFDRRRKDKERRW